MKEGFVNLKKIHKTINRLDLCPSNVWTFLFLREDSSLSAAPPTGRDTYRHQTDDVVRSVDQSSGMADQSRQIKLAAAKKKVKYFTADPA